jgi:hypothetical protein
MAEATLFFDCGPRVNLDGAAHMRWLGEEPAATDELQALIRPFPAERMRLPHRAAGGQREEG